MHELAPGLYQSRHRHGGEAWLYVISGNGHSEVDGVQPHVGGGRPDRRRPLAVAPALQRRSQEQTARLVRVHNFDALYDMMRILLDPLNLFEELPTLDAPDLTGRRLAGPPRGTAGGLGRARHHRPARRRGHRRPDASCPTTTGAIAGIGSSSRTGQKDRLLNYLLFSLRHRGRVSQVGLPIHGLVVLPGRPARARRRWPAVSPTRRRGRSRAGRCCSSTSTPTSFPSQMLGESQRAVARLFERTMPDLASRGHPMVVLLDEVEALAVSRSRASLETNPVDVHRATDAVLSGVDRVARAWPNVTFVATTNYRAGVDAAFLSRADLIEEIGQPGAAAIRAILADTLREVTGPGTPGRRWSSTRLAAAAAGSMDARQVRKLVLRAVVSRQRSGARTRQRLTVRTWRRSSRPTRSTATRAGARRSDATGRSPDAETPPVADGRRGATPSPTPRATAGRAVSGGPALGRRIPREALLLAGSIFLLIAATNILTPLLPDDPRRLRGEHHDRRLHRRLVRPGPAGRRPARPGFLADRVGPRRLSVIAIVDAARRRRSSALLAGTRRDADRRPDRVAASPSAILATVILSALSATATPVEPGQGDEPVPRREQHRDRPVPDGRRPASATAFGWRATFAVTAVLALVAAVDPRCPCSCGSTSRGRPAPARAVAMPIASCTAAERRVAIAVTNYGVVANMIHRHGFRNTILPLYAATALGLGGISIATAIALMSITGLLVATPGGMLGDRLGRRRVITAGLAAVAVGDLAFLLTGDLLTLPARRRADRLRRLLHELPDGAAVGGRAARPSAPRSCPAIASRRTSAR